MTTYDKDNQYPGSWWNAAGAMVPGDAIKRVCGELWKRLEMDNALAPGDGLFCPSIAYRRQL